MFGGGLLRRSWSCLLDAALERGAEKCVLWQPGKWIGCRAGSTPLLRTASILLTQAALKVLAGCIIASLLPCVPVDVQNPGHCTFNRTLTTMGLINRLCAQATPLPSQLSPPPPPPPPAPSPPPAARSDASAGVMQQKRTKQQHKYQQFWSSKKV